MHVHTALRKPRKPSSSPYKTNKSRFQYEGWRRRAICGITRVQNRVNSLSFEDRKTSNQKMSSMQRIKSWDEDGGKRNPLHNLHFDKVRRREVYATLEPPATNTKLTEYRRNVKQQTQPDCELNAPSKVYSNKMKVFADQLPTYELLPQWETNIRNLIPSYLQNCFPDHLQNQMNEIKLRYCQAMHTFGVNCIAAVQYGFEIPVLSDPAFKFLGHTEWRGKYLMNRCIISKKFYLPHKLIKNILAQAHTLLPEFICDFRQYRSHGYLDLNSVRSFESTSASL
ncbi:uncharacterized protein LOC105698665 isoform X2 [Orussus abietinus]|uniref:uncharacterized protein LOC105698665 isoform X2 n=1 Tax=Orussus abietinus TaxID=222816 RepID=UPI000626640C|nr:uncharacterized protein LOC105698665 isoform X2 [Orussus abietinus]